MKEYKIYFSDPLRSPQRVKAKKLVLDESGHKILYGDGAEIICIAAADVTVIQTQK